MDWKKVGWGVMIGDVVMVSGGVIYLFYRGVSSPIATLPIQDTCGAECQRYVESRLVDYDRRLAELETATMAAAAPTAKPTAGVAAKSTIRPKVKSVQYVPIPGSGSSGRNDWANLTGTEFYFDPGDYPGLVEVVFEASISLLNGNGLAFVRLYDATHGIGVQGSEVQTANQATTVVSSGRLSFWAGRNLIRVQAKSLTADTAVYSFGRLRVVAEN